MTTNVKRTWNWVYITITIPKQTCTTTFCFFNYASNITKKKNYALSHYLDSE